MQRRLKIALMVTFVISALPGMTLAAVAQEATPAATPTAITWGSCGEEVADWECATLAVPLDYANPGDQSIDLALTRLPAGDPSQRIGSLVINCGGPGCPTVGFLHQLGPMLFPPQTLAQFDIVGFDPRGVGASGQIDCQLDFEAYYAIDPSPDDETERTAWLAGGQAFADACAANGGELLPFMGTENVVSDLEELRVALGEDQLSFLGLSYGTSIGARYADRYPERVRAFALDSALPSFIDPATFIPEWVDGIERAFNNYLEDCSASINCPFSSGGDAAGAFDALIDQVDSAPLEVQTDGGTRMVGQRAVLDAVDWALSWPGRWNRLSSALAAASRGDGAGVLQLADQHNERRPDGTYGPGNTVFLAVGCLDFSITTDPAVYQEIANKAEMVAPRVGAYYATWTLPCVYWPASPTPASGPPVASGAPPILVIGASLDTQDPYQWSVDMVAQLESGVLLKRDGTGHPSYWNSACVADAVNAYLVDLTLPAVGTVCDSTGGLFEGAG